MVSRIITVLCTLQNLQMHIILSDVQLSGDIYAVFAYLMLLLTLLHFCFHVYLVFTTSASFQTRCLSRLASSWVAMFCCSCCLFVSLRNTRTMQMYYCTPFWEPKTLWVCFQPHISSCCISLLGCQLTWHLMQLFSNCCAIKRDIQTSLRGFQSPRLFLRKQKAYSLHIQRSLNLFRFPIFTFFQQFRVCSTIRMDLCFLWSSVLYLTLLLFSSSFNSQLFQTWTRNWPYLFSV